MISLWECMLIALVAFAVLKPSQLYALRQMLGHLYAFMRDSARKLEKVFDKEMKHYQLSQNEKAAKKADKSYAKQK